MTNRKLVGIAYLCLIALFVQACSSGGETPCKSDSDCDTCQVCDDGDCVAKTCDDGISCTVDVCESSSGECSHIADDGRCSGGSCDAQYGCGCSSDSDCELNEFCNQDGRCECLPDCTGKCCGDDGCGGNCTDTCNATGQTCNNQSCECEGNCQPLTCEQTGKECGTWNDGCGDQIECGGCLWECVGGKCIVCGEGADGTPEIIDDETEMDTYWVSSVGISELHQYTGPDPRHNTLIFAFFEDFTNYRVQLADRVPFSEACFVYTSRQVTTGEHYPLSIDYVTIGGLAGGDVVLMPDAGTGRVPPEILNGRAFQDQSVTIDVVSADGAGDFPSFSDTVGAPAAPVVTRLGDIDFPDLSSVPSIGITTTRTEPLTVEWETGGGDYIEIKLIPGSGSDTSWQSMRCITYDDGCIEVPASAMNNIALDAATNFQFRFERHNFVLHEIKEGSITKALSVINASSTVEGTVLR